MQRFCHLILAVVFSAVVATAAPQKSVRLRNEIITPDVSHKKALTKAALVNEKPASGLFLVQFTRSPQPDQRKQLRDLGVELLRYVPDDTFVARFYLVQPGQIQNLSFVRWVGAYRPEHKIHPGLRQKNAKAAAKPMNVAVLLSPRASDADSFQIKRLLQSVRQESKHRFGRVIRGKLNSAQLDALARSDAVLWIEPAPDMKLFDEVASKIVAGDGGTHTLYTQSLGYDGSGVKVAVADSGLNNGDAGTMHPDLAGRTPAFFYYGSLTDAADEHSHGTHVSGIIAGNGATGETDENGALYGLGVAPGASIIAQRIFDGSGNYEAPPSYEKLTSDAKKAGAEIGSNSWGDDTHGRYDISAMEFDALVRDADTNAPGDQQYILEFSAGNAGPGAKTIGSPAVAKNVIATGAAENDRPDFLIYADGPDAMADFSSRGPCEDGRIKPDITAPGTWIASLQSQSASDEFAWLPISANYQYQGGTSQSGPHVSGAAAVFVQYYRATHTNATPSPALVKAALINSAVNMEDDFGTDPAPNNDEGWGRLDLTELISSTRDYEFLDQTVLLTNGQQFEQRVLVNDPNEPLKITLTYTDEPGLPAAIPALVNDLDLEVIAPNGQVYHGNQFDGGESVAGAQGWDNLNNVEGVHIFTPLPGEYIIRVHARNVVEDARDDTAKIDQDFALVVSASIAPPGTGIVTFDRPAYRAPDIMKISLVDYSLAGQLGAIISLRSSTETNAEIIVLLASGTSGLFTKNVATATNAAMHDGVLQVSHNDVIQATYQDANPPATRVFTARADLFPPVITGVFVTNRFGHAEVRWTTDEPAASIVRYGPNGALSLAITNGTFSTSHAVPLTGLASGTTNYLKIIDSDVAGNFSTNDNGGAHYPFVVPHAPAILLVDAFFNDLFFDPPPIENYTRPLNQLGLAYDVWDVATEPNTITTNDLQPYRVVIWRLPEASFSQPTFSPSDRAALRQYLNNGGSLFVASMEATTRIEADAGDPAFLHDVLHIAQYTEDVTVPDADGVDGDPIGNGLSLTMDYAEYQDTDFSDTITPNTNAVGFLIDNSSGGFVGVRYPRVGVDSPSRVVYLSFPFDAIPENNPPNDRANVLRRILVFLAPGLNGEGNVAFDRPAYTIPSQLTVEVADSDLEGQSQTAVIISSTTQPAGLPLALQATPRPGVFRGTISLVANNSGGGDPELRVKNGDDVQASYFDASLNSTVSAHATIETNPPAISGVSVEPGYVDALVSWDTSEPTDATVQFGESPLLGRSASSDDVGDFHEITLPELSPDRTYYFRVISRDRAGNATVGDNNGQPYTFNTRAPLNPPWFDDMEHGKTNWTFYTSADSETDWELGAPSPFFPSAHSPTNCWATNLRFNFISQSESFLISPAILLPDNGNPILKFWQSYDFSYLDEDLDIANMGEVLLIPNNALAPVTLATYDGEVADWYQQPFDLTPYAGQIVYIVWHYFLFSFDAAPRQGWLVDDVSITVSNATFGKIIITNNLWQATFALSGPTNLNASGPGTVLANALPGNYVIQYGSVPYYQTPASQATNLGAGGQVTFQGNYTFADANGNGIPDLWELEHFGVVDPSRASTTDSDHDGMSDRAEFVAGTDPNNPPPPFRLTARLLANRLVQLSWPSVTNHTYRVHGSADATTWSPYSNWLPAAGTNTTFTLPTPTNGAPYLFRVEAAPPNGPNALPDSLRLTATLQPNGTVRLEWPSSINRGYRVWRRTIATSWLPFSDWIQASGSTTSFDLPTATNGASHLFRVEVAP